jgi:hypothetical protein
MASKNNIIKFFLKLFYKSPDPVEFANFKSVVNEHLPEFCEMVASDFRLYLYYERWQNRYYEKLGLPQINYNDNSFNNNVNINSSKEQKIKHFFNTYDNRALSNDELELKSRIFTHQMDLLDEVLFNNQDQFVKYLLNLK